MIISFYSLICVQLAKTKWREYLSSYSDIFINT